jgi:hypothetical protein
MRIHLIPLRLGLLSHMYRYAILGKAVGHLHPFLPGSNSGQFSLDFVNEEAYDKIKVAKSFGQE